MSEDKDILWFLHRLENLAGLETSTRFGSKQIQAIIDWSKGGGCSQIGNKKFPKKSRTGSVGRIIRSVERQLVPVLLIQNLSKDKLIVLTIKASAFSSIIKINEKAELVHNKTNDPP